MNNVELAARDFDEANKYGSVLFGLGYAYDAANRLLSDDQYTYTWDAIGILTKRTRKADGKFMMIGNGFLNALFALDRFVTEEGVRSDVAYDVLMRRGAELPLGQLFPVTRWFVHDGEDVIVEGDNSGDVRKVITHGPGIDEPLELSIRDTLLPNYTAGPGAPLVSGTSFTDFYPLTDALGSVLALVDDSGALVQTYAYDSFGNLLQESGGIPNDYGYTGRELDRKTGLMFYRNRWYDPNTGRFVSEDKTQPYTFRSDFEGVPWSPDLYAYAAQNPMTYFDPDGYSAAVEAAIIVPVAGALAVYAGAQAVKGFKKIVESTGVPYNFQVPPKDPMSPQNRFQLCIATCKAQHGCSAADRWLCYIKRCFPILFSF